MYRSPIFLMELDQIYHFNSGALFDDRSSCGKEGDLVYALEQTNCPCCLAEEWYNQNLYPIVYDRFKAFRDETKCEGTVPDFLSVPENMDLLNLFLKDNPEIAPMYGGYLLGSILTWDRGHEESSGLLEISE